MKRIVPLVSLLLLPLSKATAGTNHFYMGPSVFLQHVSATTIVFPLSP